MLIGKLLLETAAICAAITGYLVVRLKKGAIRWICLYEKEVQDKAVSLGLTTREQIKKDTVVCGLTLCLIMIVGLVVSVVCVNKPKSVREGFRQAFILFALYNIYDGIVIDELWVMHTDQWVIEGTEEFKDRYITTGKRIKRGVGAVLFFILIWLLKPGQNTSNAH